MYVRRRTEASPASVAAYAEGEPAGKHPPLSDSLTVLFGWQAAVDECRLPANSRRSRLHFNLTIDRHSQPYTDICKAY